MVANLNAPGQTVISGTAAGVELAGALARDRGARRVVALNVSGAFHSPLMAPAAERFAAVIEATPRGELHLPVVCNVDGAIVEHAAELPARMAAQLDHPVRWMDCVAGLVTLGAEWIVEVGPGSVLTALSPADRAHRHRRIGQRPRRRRRAVDVAGRPGMTSAPLQGKVALVTGASRGIGRACAVALAEAGAAVAVGYSANPQAAEEVAGMIRSAGVGCVTLGSDLADPAAAGLLVERTVAELGSVDIVVNNAGITRDNLAVRISDADWDAVIAVDLSAAFRICRAALRPMLRRRDGRIINISSVAGVMGNPGQANYSAAKAGLIGLTKALCREVGSRGITVNAVAPGFIATDMTAGLAAETLATATAAVPLGRLGTVEEVAAAVRFLALPEAAYITGHVLHVDGGLAA